ncbi:glycine amidinotransferase [Xenorhabdus doucetiae]|uniref:Glycine amidinotransferase n=1 Tax=Xenorhabdus doucetiae TaxID=351671 RepID=A0ABY3NP39_9GAMM|nr:glycine amidinotransferase [Xenorhabdus doucetiae]
MTPFERFKGIYQSPLKMLDFLSKPDHACNHENSSDTRTKTCPRIDA